MFGGKNKAVTFSYDDGVVQDKRLIELFDKYGLKATFNISSGLYGAETTYTSYGILVHHKRLQLEDTLHLYDGHEIAVHGVRHLLLDELNEEELLQEVEGDRIALERIYGQKIAGMAYACGRTGDAPSVLPAHGSPIRYARTTISTHSFAPQSELLRFHPTVHHTEWDEMFRLAEEFLSLKTDTPQIFYIWGHSYEFDMYQDWDKMEAFCQKISGKTDIFYGTNREVLLGE